VAGNSDTVFVVLKIKHPENGRRLAPHTVRFRAEGMSQFVDLSTPDSLAIERLLPANAVASAGGFARYLHGTWDTPDADEYFRYWFRWPVSGYSAAVSGRRTFTVESTNYAGMSRTDTLKWGPEILSVTKVGDAGSEQRFRLQVRAWVGEDAATANTDVSAGAWATGADWYRYELPAGGRWAANNATIFEETGSAAALVKLRDQEFLWTPPTSGGTASVTVRSRTVPAIAHQMEISDMAFIPAGSFTMGNSFTASEGYSDELPTHSVYVSAFYMDKYEVTKAMWDEVYNWAITRGYSFDNPGLGKGATHPVQTVNWYDAVKWCNARSEKEGRIPAYYTGAGQTAVYRTGQVNVDNTWLKWNSGYRLPTEAEWEKAARGGTGGHRFPWADTDNITHSRANYYGYPASSGGYAYDLAPVGYHPTFNNGGTPYTSPVGYFAANGYGLYDMAGNVWEWCWDWYGVYGSASQTDPRGPATGSSRVFRGGGWLNVAINCRAAARDFNDPTGRGSIIGFRSVLPTGQP